MYNTSMASSTGVFIFLLFSVLCFSSSHHSSCYALDQPINPPSPPLPAYYISINSTCWGVTYYDLCVTSLRSDPESASNPKDWGMYVLISLRLSLKNITDTNDYIKQLLLLKNSSTSIVVGGSSSVDGVTLKESLKHCEGSYGLAIQSVKASMEYFHVFKYRNLLKNANYALRNVTDCVKEINMTSLSPLKQKNTLSSQLLKVSYDLGVRLVSGHGIAPEKLESYQNGDLIKGTDPMERLQTVKGHLVSFPLDFMRQEDLRPVFKESEYYASSQVFH